MNTMTWLGSIALATASVTLLGAQGPSPAMRLQASSTYLSRPVEFRSATLAEAVAPTLRSAAKAGGMVTISGCGDPMRSPLSLPADSSLAAALDLIAAVFPTHYWTTQEGGAINLLPKQNMPSVADVRIRQFEWETSANIYSTVDRLFHSEGVGDRLAKLSLRGGLVTLMLLQRAPRVINGVPERPQKGPLQRIEDATLLQALNAIVVSYGNGFWWYEEHTCGSERTYSIEAN